MADAPASYLIDQTGETVTVPADQAGAAIDLGYVQATPDQIQRFQTAHLAGDQPGLAFGAGAARGATFGLSDTALTKLGLSTPEKLDVLRQANPAATGLGEIGGAIGTSFIPGAPVNLLTRAGRGVQAGIEGAVPGLLRRGIGAAAGNAVVGAGFGAGQVLTERALGDPNGLAENWAGTIGMSALLGGAIGAAVETGPVMAGRAIRAAGRFGRDLVEKAGPKAAELLGGPVESIGKFIMENRAIVGDKSFAAKMENFVAINLDETLDSGGKLLPKLKKIADRINDPISDEGLAVSKFDDALRRAKNLRIFEEENVARMVSGGPGTDQMVEAADDLSRAYTDLQAVAEKHGLIEEGMTDATREMNEETGKFILAGQEAQKTGKTGEIKGPRISTIIRTGEAGALLKFMGWSGTARVSTIAAGAQGVYKLLEFAKSPAAQARLLNSMEEGALAMDTAIERGVGAALRKAAPVAQVAAGEAAVQVVSHGKSDRAAAREFERVSQQVSLHTEDDESLARSVAENAAHLHGGAPETHQAALQLQVRALTFLKSKLPNHPATGPLGVRWAPSRTEVSKFMRYVEAVRDPTVILKLAARGTLTQDHVEAVRTVYPDLFGRIQGQFWNRVSDMKPGQIPYRARLMGSMLTGQDLDGSIRTTMGNQRSLTGPPGQQAGPTGRAPKPSKLPSEIMTPTQRAASRGVR